MATIDNTLPPNFPTPPIPPTMSLRTHPKDLVVDDRSFYTQVQFIPYSGFSATGAFDLARGRPDNSGSLVNGLLFGGSTGGSANPTNGVVLPIPRKLNDIQTVTWTETGIAHDVASAATKLAALSASSATDFGISNRRNDIFNLIASAGSTASVLSGFQLNPMLWMMFKNPEFKVFQFSWQFTPVDQEESVDVVEIINYFKRESLPATNLGGFLYEYPSIALIKFFPNDFFTFRMKPCAILNVEVDYTGGGMPSFFKNGAPTVINLTVVAKEINLWTKNNFGK